VIYKYRPDSLDSSNKPMRLLMMGTGPFAVPTFRVLYDTSHTVAALVMQPPRPVHGRRKTPVNPMRQVALEHGTPVLEPESINTDQARAELARYEPELFIVADYGQILASQTLAVAAHGGINLHGSLLPKYRGAAPINWALYHGETETGVTVIHMTPRVDAGPCLAQARLAIDPDETAVELESRLAELGAPLVCRTIDAVAAGETEGLPQDPAQATPARRLRKSDGEVDWSRPAAAIRNQVRALEPWPRTSTSWHRAEGKPLRLILCQVSVQAGSAGQTSGTVVDAQEGQLLVATGQQLLSLDQVQPAGKRPLSAAELLRGYRIAVGDRLGPEALD
jgi:methionyl-tRNA formyltransferase